MNFEEFVRGKNSGDPADIIAKEQDSPLYTELSLSVARLRYRYGTSTVRGSVRLSALNLIRYHWILDASRVAFAFASRQSTGVFSALLKTRQRSTTHLDLCATSPIAQGNNPLNHNVVSWLLPSPWATLA